MGLDAFQNFKNPSKSFLKSFKKSSKSSILGF